MSWIKTISFQEATGKLKQIYNRVTGPDNNVDNILQVHGLRPHSLEGHMKLYKNVLHHQDNVLSTEKLEVIGVYVSLLNQCKYCIEHHFSGLSRWINDDEKAKAIRTALEQGDLNFFDEKEAAWLTYVRKLTVSPQTLEKSDVDELKEVGLTDGEILEINQVTSYFAYANRTVLGLGVSLDGDILGLSPNDKSDGDNWGHH